MIRSLLHRTTSGAPIASGHGLVPVSYTHLDVYKRQEYADETTYHTVCNDCGQVIDGIDDQHIKETGHSGYSTNVPITDEVLVSEGYTQEVVDTPAYDETVADALVCTLCGETRPIDGTVQ